MSIGGWKNVPAVIVGAAMLIVVGASVAARLAQYIGVIDPHVQIFADRTPEGARERAGVRPLTPSAMDGEVTRTTERLRELSAVTTALALYAAGERLRGRTPGTVSDLLAGVTKEGLMPPGVTSESQPGLLTVAHSGGTGGDVAHGNLFVRYRPRPFGVEVVAVGRERRDGPALMMRVPDGAKENEGVSYYMATRLDGVRIPAAFAEESQVISAGWTKQLLRAVKVPREEHGDLREWAGRRAH